jgi:hypothetical protein
MEQGKERRNAVTTGNEEVQQRNTRTEEKLAEASTQHATRQSYQATLSRKAKTVT